METQLSNADADSLQRLLNLSLGAKENTAKIVNGSRSANSTNPQYQPLDIEFVEKILNYKFKDKSLLLQAFTDATFDENCVSYERLEFLGDTVLNMVITKYLYNRYGDCSPGLLTNLRAVNVDTEKLARVAVKHNLHRCLRHKKPLLEDQILEFTKAMETYPLHSRGLLKVPKSLADIVESTIGALYTDCDSFETVWKVILYMHDTFHKYSLIRLIIYDLLIDEFVFDIINIHKVVMPLLEPIISLDKLENHPMTELHEMCQKKNLKLRFDDSTWEVDKRVLVFIEDKLVGRGHHLAKKDSAKNCAAKDALDNFSYFFTKI
ncbi:ribonuclease 3-like protein 3 isoform X1 [Brassica rapa]|uniref:ribonuclease 3-like protein 3 isoform X1 n=1 Tax=Brassica campestris TaxID=3711 RepID=UPI00142DE1A2|nr:ribonuclease 3-like protein 3 isoform X1 [Brassica rapa]XP_048632732.1 ribonuclease 3-like protein 3 isoform X1 [Brassica napus]